MAFVLRERSSFVLHLAGRLPGPGDDLAHAAHGLGIRAHHAENAHVMKHVLRRDGLRADAGIREGDILRNPFVQMMADHQHVQVLVDGIDRVRHGRIRGGWEHIGGRRRADDIRRVAAARSLCMIGVNGPASDSRQRVLHAAAFIQGVRMNRYLHVIIIRHVQAVVDDSRSGAPVLVNLESHGSGFDLLDQRLLVGAVAFPEETEIHRIFLCRLQHHLQIPGARGTGGRIGSIRRPCASSDHCGYAAVQRAVNLLGADKMDMRIDSARCHDKIFSCEGFRRRSHRHAGRHAVHNVRISGFSDSFDFSVLDSDIRLNDTVYIHDQRIGNHQIQISVRAFRLHRLSHTITDGLSAAEFYFVSISGIILLHFYYKACVGQTHLIAHSGAVHGRIFTARYFYTHCLSPPYRNPFSFARSMDISSVSSPVCAQVRSFRPNTRRRPPIRVSCTSFSSPGSKRTEVPDGISR